MRCAIENPVDDLKYLHLFKAKHGPFDSVKVLRVYPGQRLFVLVCQRPDKSHTIALWDDVEAWIPDNKGVYGRLIEGFVGRTEHARSVGMNYRDAVIQNQLMWVDCTTDISGVHSVITDSETMRMDSTVFHQNMFVLLMNPHKVRGYWSAYVAPIDAPYNISWIMTNRDDDDEIKNYIQRLVNGG